MNDEELINSEFGAINDCREHKRLGWIPPEFELFFNGGGPQ